MDRSHAIAVNFATEPTVRCLPVATCLTAILAMSVASNVNRVLGQAPVSAAPTTDSRPTLIARLPQTRPATQTTQNYIANQASAALRVPKISSEGEIETIPPGSEDETEGVTLDEMTRIAMANSPVVREAELQAAIARARAYQASLYPNPTMGHASPQLAGDQSQYNAYVIQDLVTKGKIRLDTAAAERAAQAAEFKAVRARFDVLTMVRQRFFIALASQRRVEVLENMVGITRSARDTGERLLRAQLGSRGDVLLLQIELSRAEAELRNAVTLAETSKSQLAAGTGLIDLTISRVRGELAEPMSEYDLFSVQQGVIARNALMRSAELEIARAQVLARRAEVEPFPNVNVMGGYQNQGPGAMAPQTQALYQIQMIVPLFNRNQGNIRATQVGISTAVAQYNRVRTELANDSAAAVGRYLTAKQLAERYENEILPSAVQLQGIYSELYKQGQEGFLRYLASQRALVDANLAYISAQEARLTAAAEVAGLLQSEQFP